MKLLIVQLFASSLSSSSSQIQMFLATSSQQPSNCVLLDESLLIVVGIATDYRLDYRGVGVRVPAGSRIFSSPRCPDRLWSPPSLLSNGYRGLFPRGLNGWGAKLAIHLYLVPKSRKCGSIRPLPVRLHGVVLN
jgi:hypothetical protein